MLILLKSNKTEYMYTTKPIFLIYDPNKESMLSYNLRGCIQGNMYNENLPTNRHCILNIHLVWVKKLKHIFIHK